MFAMNTLQFCSIESIKLHCLEKHKVDLVRYISPKVGGSYLWKVYRDNDLSDYLICRPGDFIAILTFPLLCRDFNHDYIAS